jgi:hypothetical protein
MGKRTFIPFLLLWGWIAAAADSGPDLWNAARKGQTDQVRALLEKGAAVESRDRDGRTALMLAAEHGHPDTVSLLLSKGAKTDARDKEGWTPYGLALLSTSKGRDRVLNLLPAPARVRLALEATWIPENTYSSCFMTPQQLAERIREVKPDALAIEALREVSSKADTRFIELVSTEADAVLKLRVRPGAMCVQQQSSDNLRMEIDVQLMRKGSDAAIWQKTFGGGLKGLKARAATSPVQYGPLYEEWAKAQAAAIYWGTVGALLKDADPGGR